MSGINAANNYSVRSEIWKANKQAASAANAESASESKKSSNTNGVVDSASTSIDATFKLALRQEAIQFTDLEKRTHDLLGYVVKGFEQTMEAGTEISFASLFKSGSQGQSFSDSLIGMFTSYAASRSISWEYTSNQSFAESYRTNSYSAVEESYTNLKRNMEGMSVAKGVDGDVEVKISHAAYMMEK